MDFFYVWIRRCIATVRLKISRTSSPSPLSTKWDMPNRWRADRRLLAATVGNRAERPVRRMKNGMLQAFRYCSDMPCHSARTIMVVVFANKQPDAWGGSRLGCYSAGFVVSWHVGQLPLRLRHSARVMLDGASLVLLCLARLQEASRGCSPRLGQPRSGRDATKHPCQAPRLLGCGYPGTRLRLGSNGTGDGGVQQAPSRQEGERAGQAHGGQRVPSCGPQAGRRFRGRAGLDRR